MRTLSRKSFAIGLLVALLVCYTGRAVPVYALADPVSIYPVFDTQIIQLSDYVDTLTEPQVDIFYILAGVLVAKQGGANKYKLTDPFANENDVISWLKSCGIQLYNTIIDYYPERDVVTGVDMRSIYQFVVAELMGDAVVAANYDNFQSFIDDNPQFTLTKDLQTGLNTVFGLKGGLYQWQFNTQPFRSRWEWVMYDGMSNIELGQYNSYVESMSPPVVRVDSSTSSPYNIQEDTAFFAQYRNIFINTTNNTVHLVNALGQDAPTGYFSGGWVGYYPNSWGVEFYDNTTCGRFVGTQSFNSSSYNNYQEVVQAVFDQYINLFGTNEHFFFQDFIQASYAGTSWNDKVLVQNLTNLDFEINNVPYYEQVQTDVLIDIRDFIEDLVNTIDIPFDYENTTLVSIDLTPITDLLAPPVPVDLNEIAELTDNSYLERVKEEAQRGGNALAYLVAFWHNCDAELIYVLFGAGITVLVGAFIGKWGHS